VEGTDNKKNTYRFLVGKDEGKRTVKRPRHKWKTILTNTINKLDEMVWAGLIQLRTEKCGRPL
jgi:hypothetical protein